MNQTPMVKLFLQRAEDAGSMTAIAHNIEEFHKVISELLQEQGLVYCPGLTDKEKAVPVSPVRKTENYQESVITIEEAFGGVAETGTVICSSSSGKFLQASLLPEHHVAIVPQERIFERFSDFFASCSTMPTHLTLVTGPSRTADIEKTLVIGMHGPKRVTVIVW